MMDSKKKTREQILGELESIQQLLGDDELPEPPLLTDTDAPLLTEAVEDEEADWDPPILRETLGDQALPDEPQSSDVDDLAQQRSGDQPQAPADPQPEATDSRAVAEEQQPGLFDSGAEAAPTHDAPRGADDSWRRRESDSGATLPKSENPFLPKHIRDRLTANRLLQAELVKSLGQAPAPGQAPQAAKAVSDQAVEALVDELVRRFLPQMEAELRRRLRELVAEAEEDDPPTG